MSTALRITKFLLASPGQRATRRDIFKRFSYIPMFQDSYDHLVFKAVIREWGSGKKGDPIVVRLERPDFTG